MIQAAQNDGMGGKLGPVECDWRAKNVGVMQGGGASQTALLEASAKNPGLGHLHDGLTRSLQRKAADNRRSFPRLPTRGFRPFLAARWEIAVSLIAKPVTFYSCSEANG
jgi:hypothetical protein